MINYQRGAEELIKFASFKEFRAYTLRGRVFMKKRAKENTLLRALLRKLF